MAEISYFNVPAVGVFEKIKSLNKSLTLMVRLLLRLAQCMVMDTLLEGSIVHFWNPRAPFDPRNNRLVLCDFVHTYFEEHT